MTNSFPPDPERQRENNDERLAVFVALAAIGTILFWGITRGGDSMNLARLNPLADATIGADSGGDSGIGDNQLSNFGDPAEDDAVIDIPDREAIAEPLAGLSIFSPFRSDDTEAARQGMRGAGEERGTMQWIAPPSSEQTELDAALQQNGEGSDPSEPLASEPPELDEEGTAAVPTPEADTASPEEDEIDTEADNELSSPDETAQEENLPPAIAFPDVADEYWAKPFIDSLSQRGIIGGFDDGRFQPDSILTRAQFAASLKQAFVNGNDASPTNASPTNYIDVDPGYWAAESIQIATQIGFMSGYPEQDFRPENQMTRLEAIVALVTGLNLPTPANPEAVLQVYGDRPDIPEWAVEKVAAATEAGMVISYPNTDVLNPDVPITRAETSALIYQALTNEGRVPEISSEYSVKGN